MACLENTTTKSEIRNMALAANFDLVFLITKNS